MSTPPYGSLFYAGAADFEEEAPTGDQAQQAVVILIMRGRKNVGSTFLNVLQRYAEALRENGGQLILTDVSDPVREQLNKTGMSDVIGVDNILSAQPLVLASLREALAVGQRHLAKLGQAGEADAGQDAESPESQACGSRHKRTARQWQLKNEDTERIEAAHHALCRTGDLLNILNRLLNLSAIPFVGRCHVQPHRFLISP